MREQQKLPLNTLNWVAFDLDGTLAEGLWTPDSHTDDIGKPVRAMVSLARFRRYDQGKTLVIYTARPWEHYGTIREWLRANWIGNVGPGELFEMIVCGKLLVGEQIDDRAHGLSDPVVVQDLEALRSDW